MLFAFAFGVDKDINQIYYYKNVELLYQNLVNISLKCDRYIGQSKRHQLILEIAIASPESCFLFIAFPNSHLIVGNSQIKLSGISSPN